MNTQHEKKATGLTPMIVTGEYLTEAFRRWGFDCAVETCPDMTLRQFKALLDGRARLIGDTGSGIFYEGGVTPTPGRAQSEAAMLAGKGASDA